MKLFQDDIVFMDITKRSFQDNIRTLSTKKVTKQYPIP